MGLTRSCALGQESQMVVDKRIGDEPLAGAALGAADHAGLELRRVALGLCADLFRWSQSRGGDESSLALRRHLEECRAPVVLVPGPIACVDDSAPTGDPAKEWERLERVVRQLDSLGLNTPLSRLQRVASLDDVEVDLLLLAALPHQSALWGALFAFLANSSTARRPTVHVALNFTHRASAGAISAALASGGLIRYGLLRMDPVDAALADRALVLPAESWLALCGHDAVEPILGAWLDRGAPVVSAILPDALRFEVDAVA